MLVGKITKNAIQKQENKQMKKYNYDVDKLKGRSEKHKQLKQTQEDIDKLKDYLILYHPYALESMHSEDIVKATIRILTQLSADRQKLLDEISKYCVQR